jgi:gamma-glutamyltranspeptidase/glutathione hydrolase
MKRLVLGIVLALLGTWRVEGQPQAMVAAAHPLAVEAGLDLLRRGGTAIDAAVAVQMVLGVVEPHASGIGGGGFLLHYDAQSGRSVAYDGREAAPAGAQADMFLGRDGKPIEFRHAVVSGISVGVPGVVSMLEFAHREHGKLPWAELFKPAIALARDGTPVAPRLAGALDRLKSSVADDPMARSIYFNADGTPKRVGETMANRPLAETMEHLAQHGSAGLMRGAIVDEIVARVKAHVRPGALEPSDFAIYKPLKREPVCAPYRVWLVCGMPPPSSGGVAVLQMLALLEPFELHREPPNSARALHLIAEASRLAFADRVRYLGDPDFVDVPVRGLLAPAYIAERRKLISPDRSIGPQPVEPGYPERGTSHVTIVDRVGNAVAFTSTIEATFGSQAMVRGFFLNNELTDFAAVPETDGRLHANRVQGGKRPRSSMAPTFVFDRTARLVAALGSAGGARIIGDTLQALIGLLDWNLSMQDAIDLPRVTNLTGVTELEDAAAIRGMAERLRGLGHQVQLRRHEGGLAGIRRQGTGLDGGADKRRDGVARGE